MNQYLLIHTHRHGTDTIAFNTERDMSGLLGSHYEGVEERPEFEELLRHFDIDYEPEREEYIDVSVAPVVAVW